MGILDSVRAALEKRQPEPWYAEGEPIRRWPRDREIVDGTKVHLFDRPKDGSTLEVVGESFYQATIGRLAEGRDQYGALQKNHVALLVPEPWNPHDEKAVRVVVLPAGQVGHLSRRDAVAYRSVVERIGEDGMLTGCHARIIGGREGAEYFGVLLYLGKPKVCLKSYEAGAIAALEAGWRPDPLGRHDQRYWNGEEWTEHVFTNGVQAVDPL